MEALQRPVPRGGGAEWEDVERWAIMAYATANQALFQGRLSSGRVLIDPTWHARGGAGGARPSDNTVVLDPSVHSSLLELCGTLLHEMVHLAVGNIDGDEEHGQHFIQTCLAVNEAAWELASLDVREGKATCWGAFCRLGRFDLLVDRSMLTDAGIDPQVANCFAQGAWSREDWDHGLLIGDLHAAASSCGMGFPPVLASRLLSLCVSAACRRALQGGSTLMLETRSRTMASHFASRRARDYTLFSDLETLWRC